jgi:hypothetical protein
MSKRKTLTAEPNVRIEDIMAAREGRKLKKMKINFSYLKIYVIWKKHVVQKKSHQLDQNFIKFSFQK